MNIQDYKPTAEQLNNIRMNILTSDKFRVLRRYWRIARVRCIKQLSQNN